MFNNQQVNKTEQDFAFDDIALKRASCNEERHLYLRKRSMSFLRLDHTGMPRYLLWVLGIPF